MIPGSGRSPGRGHGNPLQYSCLESPTDREAWWATAYSVAKSQPLPKRLGTHTCMQGVIQEVADMIKKNFKIHQAGKELGSSLRKSLHGNTFYSFVPHLVLEATDVTSPTRGIQGCRLPSPQL